MLIQLTGIISLTRAPLISVLGREVRSHLIGLLLTLTITSGGCGTGDKEHQAVEIDSSTEPVADDVPLSNALNQMRSLMASQDWKGANEHVPEVLIANPDDASAITDAAKVRGLNGHKHEAAELLVAAATLSNYQPKQRVKFAVAALLEVGELYKAIELLEHAVNANPKWHDLRRMLVGFLGEAESFNRIPQHLQELIRARQFDAALLVALTENSARRFSTSTMDELFRRNPKDHRVRFGEARQLMDYRDANAAITLLDEILKHYPRFAPGHALLGQALIEAGHSDRLKGWLANAPSDSKEYCEYWLTLGDMATAQGKQKEAARAYWEATKRDPNNVTAWNRLSQSSQLLASIDHSETDSENPASATETVSQLERDSIGERIADLLELRKRFYDFSTSERKSQLVATKVAELLLRLGRNWEAEAWSATAVTLKSDPTDQLQELRVEIINRLQQDQSWISSKRNLALKIDLSGLPEFVGGDGADNLVAINTKPKVATADHIRFSHESNSWGLGGVGGGNNPSNDQLKALARTTGVGGGAIDFDLDGLIDIIVRGAGGTILKEDSQPTVLMRNLGTKLVDFAASAGVNDRHFGQGVAVGDFNDDGFPDLFLANLGANRLFRNNGDGTFFDCSSNLLDSSDGQWTTSAAFIDVDQDQVTDLVTINYCEVSPALAHPCPTAGGGTSNCHPLEFPGQSDGLFCGVGDGSFKNQSNAWSENVSPGRGLGLIGGMFDRRQVGVYVANDMSANNYLITSANDDSAGEPNVQDMAATAGLAVDARSLTQASMGMAASDFDNDGDLDFYITGFAREYNIFYEQVSTGLWVDRTHRLGLVESTLMTVGFGTDAIDVDNDGLDEIIVANGHIGIFSEADSVPYEQPLQVFRRQSSGTFGLLADDHWDRYFAT
ncbi:MAG: FG-GAP-like repeat-containing protein, partial [Pirellulaceae bacterium]